ncbi:Bacterial transcription activator, effector binding domain [compost metagenome]
MTAPIRFEQGRPMLLGGLRRHHEFQQGDFGGQWRDFGALGPLPGQLGEHAYGVICGADATSCEYMCAVEVAALEVLPKTLGRMRIDPQTYAVFLHRGHVSTLPQTWQGALDWLARSDYESAHKPDFERYGAAFDPETGGGELEVWLAVRPRQAIA